MRIRLAATLAIGAMLAAAACGADEPENDGADAAEAVESATAEAAAEDDGAGTGADGGGEGLGACDDGAVSEAVAAIVAATDVRLAVDDSEADRLSCTWDTGQDVGPAVYLTAGPSIDAGLTEELLETMGQTPIEDERFASVDAILVEVLGCENGHAGDLTGCALTVYGSYDVTLQVLFAEEVTVDQMTDAAWAITEQIG